MRTRAPVLLGKTISYATTCGNLFVTLNRSEKGELEEIRLTMGKSGHCVRGFLELVGILFSIIFQMDISTDEKIDILKKHSLGISCGEKFKIDDTTYTSCLDLIAQVCLEELKVEKKK